MVIFHVNAKICRRMQINLTPETFPSFRFGWRKWHLNGMAGWSSQSLKTTLDLFSTIHSFPLALEMRLKFLQVEGYSDPGWNDKGEGQQYTEVLNLNRAAFKSTRILTVYKSSFLNKSKIAYWTLTLLEIHAWGEGSENSLFYYRMKIRVP